MVWGIFRKFPVLSKTFLLPICLLFRNSLNKLFPWFTLKQACPEIQYPLLGNESIINATKQPLIIGYGGALSSIHLISRLASTSLLFRLPLFCLCAEWSTKKNDLHQKKAIKPKLTDKCWFGSGIEIFLIAIFLNQYRNQNFCFLKVEFFTDINSAQWVQNDDKLGHCLHVYLLLW